MQRIFEDVQKSQQFIIIHTLQFTNKSTKLFGCGIQKLSIQVIHLLCCIGTLYCNDLLFPMLCMVVVDGIHSHPPIYRNEENDKIVHCNVWLLINPCDPTGINWVGGRKSSWLNCKHEYLQYHLLFTPFISWIFISFQQTGRPPLPCAIINAEISGRCSPSLSLNAIQHLQIQ